jgi:hypothetical protein
VSQVVTSHGENPTLQITTVKLDGLNYLAWSQSALLSIKSRGKMGYLNGRIQILVNWKELSLADATWELLSDFKLRFPTFTLEDKGHFKRGGVLRTYTRRNKTLVVNPSGGLDIYGM